MQRTAYAPDRIVPIYFDTETTGLPKWSWWQPQSARIVQIAAISGGRDSKELKLDINPFPVAMTEAASETTKLGNRHVWGACTPQQVRKSSLRVN
jgi:hypothetical protein